MTAMDKYIKKEEAIRALLNDAPEQVGYSREDAADCIRYMDAADVAPVRHGRWIWHSKERGYLCSECGSGCLLNYESDWHKSDWCPHCGAKMDLEG